MFERFTDQARQMILTAQEESRLLQHDYIGTEHLLIAATEVDDSLTATLAALGITTESLRGIVTRMVAPGGHDRPGDVPFTAEATAVLERALREALQLGHGAIRPGHVVLGLLDVHDGTMPVLLARVGVRAGAIRAAVLVLFNADPDNLAAVTAAPVCPKCGAPISEGLRVTRLSIDGQSVRIAYCGVCGAVVPVTFDA